MISAGAACGVSVAFGAPIGGALFSYEISKPNTFWTFNMLWRVFTATSIACFTLSLLQSLATGSPLSLSDSGALKFGYIGSSGENSMLDLPAALIIGIVAGLLGALFINIAVRLSSVRKQYITTNTRKIVECLTFAFVTASAFYGVVYFRRDNCKNILDENTHHEQFRLVCPENQYNPFATLIFNTEGGTLRQFFRYPQLIADSAVNTT